MENKTNKTNKIQLEFINRMTRYNNSGYTVNYCEYLSNVKTLYSFMYVPKKDNQSEIYLIREQNKITLIGDWEEITEQQFFELMEKAREKELQGIYDYIYN